MATSKARNKKRKALKISNETYNKVYNRDTGCVLCKTIGIHPKVQKRVEQGLPTVLECHHFVSRGKLGMGIEENLVMLCKCHHQEESTHRSDIENYLKSQYDNWNKKDLIFNKEDF